MIGFVVIFLYNIIFIIILNRYTFYEKVLKFNVLFLSNTFKSVNTFQYKFNKNLPENKLEFLFKLTLVIFCSHKDIIIHTLQIVFFCDFGA